MTNSTTVMRELNRQTGEISSIVGTIEVNTAARSESNARSSPIPPAPSATRVLGHSDALSSDALPLDAERFTIALLTGAQIHNARTGEVLTREGVFTGGSGNGCVNVVIEACVTVTGGGHGVDLCDWRGMGLPL